MTALLSLSDVMVANDTGPLHLAAALGRPIVAPYTCTKVALNGEVRGVIPGEAFNSALTRIWLGDKPAQGDLKKAMLGG